MVTKLELLTELLETTDEITDQLENLTDTMRKFHTTVEAVIQLENGGSKEPARVIAKVVNSPPQVQSQPPDNGKRAWFLLPKGQTNGHYNTKGMLPVVAILFALAGISYITKRR